MSKNLFAIHNSNNLPYEQICWLKLYYRCQNFYSLDCSLPIYLILYVSINQQTHKLVNNTARFKTLNNEICPCLLFVLIYWRHCFFIIAVRDIFISIFLERTYAIQWHCHSFSLVDMEPGLKKRCVFHP